MCVFSYFPGMFIYICLHVFFFSKIATSSQGCRVGLLVKPMAFEAWILAARDDGFHTLHLKGVI